MININKKKEYKNMSENKGIFSFLRRNKNNDNIVEKGEALSTYRYEIKPKNNLPVIFTNSSYSIFGENNLYPNEIAQSFQMSPAHMACYRFIFETVLGGGYSFDEIKDVNERIRFEKFLKLNDFNIFLREITKDYLQHSRINILNKNERYVRISPVRTRYSIDKKTLYVSNVNEQFYAAKTYSVNSGETKALLYDDVADYYEPYPLPYWSSAFQSINLNSKINDFQESNCANSVNPSLVIKKIGNFETAVEKAKYINELKASKGVNETGSVLLFTSPTKDMMTEVQQLEANKNGDLFLNLRENTIEDICFGWGISPILIGMKTPGSLGSSNELELALQKVEGTVIKNVIKHIEYVINDILKQQSFMIKFKINPNRIYTEIKE